MVRRHVILTASQVLGNVSGDRSARGEGADIPGGPATAAPQHAGIPVQGHTDPTASRALRLIADSGLVGMGGAGYPTWKKLSHPEGCSVVIANGAECEPLLAHNVARLETDADRIVAGLALAIRILGARRGIVALKARNADAVRAVEAAVGVHNSGNRNCPQISVSLLEDRYPIGDARAIVRDVLGTLIGPTDHTISAGAVLLNVETLLRVHEIVAEGRAMDTKDITVAGLIEGSGCRDDTSLVVYDVPIGTTIRCLLDALGITPPADAQLLLGGPYMGEPAQLDDPITATSGGIMIGAPEIPDPGPVGIIVCACGASENRLRSIVEAEGAPLAATVRCRNAVTLADGRLKCVNPGVCPGQAQAVLALRKQGATGVLISHCTDCTNTVMQIAPRLGMRVHHATDAYLRAGQEHLIRAAAPRQASHR